MGNQFDIKDMGPCKWLLGMTIEQNLTYHTFTIHQASYIRELLRRFGMADCKTVATATSPNDPRNSPLLDDTSATHYRSVVGALLYA
jgi:hypothetical protein